VEVPTLACTDRPDH